MHDVSSCVNHLGSQSSIVVVFVHVACCDRICLFLHFIHYYAMNGWQQQQLKVPPKLLAQHCINVMTVTLHQQSKKNRSVLRRIHIH